MDFDQAKKYSITTDRERVVSILKFAKEQVFGFVIVSRNPIRSTEMQVLGNEFRKKIGAKLEVHSREWTHKI